MEIYNNAVIRNFYKLRNPNINIHITNFYILLCYNHSPAAISILEKNVDRINWYILSSNPAAMGLLLKYKQFIVFSRLSLNPAPEARVLLKQNHQKIDWEALCKNPSPAAFELLLQHKEKLNWSSYVVRDRLSANPAAIDYLLEHEHFISSAIAYNTSPKAIKWLRNHPGRINWLLLSSNPAAMPLIMKEPHKINWPNFSMKLK